MTAGEAVARYGRILVPVDGSATASRGLQEAARLARLTGACLRLIHVLDAGDHGNGFETAAAYVDTILPRMLRDGRRILDEARASVDDGAPHVSTLLLDKGVERLADVVVAQARAWHADLIVVGSHGRRGWDRLTMGSDAEQIVRCSPVPVLVVRTEGPGADGEAERRPAIGAASVA